MDVKRYSVFINGHLCGCFDELKDAEDFIFERWWLAMATIWDHQTNTEVYTEVRIQTW